MHPFLTIGNVQIPCYALMISIGVIAGFLFALYNCKNYRLKKRHLVGVSLFSIIGLILGAKVFYALSVLPDIISNWTVASNYPGETLYYAFSGYVFYGGLFGMLISIVIYSMQFKVHFYRLINTIVPSIALAHGFGRIGCFLAGCCYGCKCTGPLCVTFPKDSIIEGLAGTTRFPIQIVESILCFCLFVFLVILAKKGCKNLLKPYLLTYAVIRFILEFFRGDAFRGIWGPFSLSQWVSLAIIAVIVILFVRNKSHKTVDNL